MCFSILSLLLSVTSLNKYPDPSYLTTTTGCWLFFTFFSWNMHEWLFLTLNHPPFLGRLSTKTGGSQSRINTFSFSEKFFRKVYSLDLHLSTEGWGKQTGWWEEIGGVIINPVAALGTSKWAPAQLSPLCSTRTWPWQQVRRPGPFSVAGGATTLEGSLKEEASISLHVSIFIPIHPFLPFPSRGWLKSCYFSSFGPFCSCDLYFNITFAVLLEHQGVKVLPGTSNSSVCRHLLCLSPIHCCFNPSEVN